MKIFVVFVLVLFLVGVTMGFSRSFQSCPEYERNALLDFKRSVIDQSNRLSSWEGENCCGWYGVGCNNRTGHVVKLDLRNPFTNYLGGDLYNTEEMDVRKYEEACLTVVEVNHSLLELQHLSYLDLSWNNFTGMRIPNFFGSFPKLRYLNLSSAQFSGVAPYQLGNLSSLLSLDLSDKTVYQGYYYYTSLEVDNFHWVSSLASLQYLDMSGINLSNIRGEPSDETASFPSDLLELHLHSCELGNFSLFHSHQNLTSLLVLGLSRNTGVQSPIPNTIWNMTALEVLDLSWNQWNCSGTVLDGFGNLKNLLKLDMHSTPCASPFPNSLSRLQNLKYLDLSLNSFHGPIPASLGTLSQLSSLHLNRNNFHGKLPATLQQCTELQFLDFGENKLSGKVPSWIGANLSSLEILRLRSNNFSGSLSLNLCRLGHLRVLDMADNSLSGSIPHCFGKFEAMVYHRGERFGNSRNDAMGYEEALNQMLNKI